MAEEEIGYPTKMFIQSAPNTFMCTICQGVLRQAQRVCDNDHMYCAACVGQWARSSDKCPTCRSVMSAKPARVLNNLITELAIRCCSAHVCPYEWICCPYSKQFGCSHFVLRKDIAQHSDDASAHLLLIATKLAMLPALMARSVHLERTAVEEKRTTTMGRESTRTNITTNKLTWVNSNPT
ncbi:hypothetical protein B484DRAFT_403028 [Ochromonadaceae sp. CCMP2298]|nr:hypothetical protein B484DRAFT_403028 [Ochromonadaceae sp. CCMP2298]